MLNNGHVSGMGTPDGGQPGGMYGHPGGHSDYHPNNYLGPSPNSGNGIMGHHSGGICSQMTINQNSCPPIPRYCSGCKGPIMERYLLHALDQFWHHSCLKCTHCSTTLADLGQSCYTRDGLILCRHDYLKLFGNGGACHGCGLLIPASEMVMRASVPPPGSSPPLVYHMKCFTCNKCRALLSTGDRYSVFNGALYCESDALKMMKNGIGSPSNANVATTNGPAAPRKGKVGRPRRSRD